MQIGPERPHGAEMEEKQQHRKISKIIVQVVRAQTLPQPFPRARLPPAFCAFNTQEPHSPARSARRGQPLSTRRV